MASDPLGRHDRGARAGEGVEHDVTAPRAVLDGVGYEGDRLGGGMRAKLLQAAGAKRVHAGVVPHVRARTPVPPEFDPPAWELSIDRLLSLAPPLLLLAHFGPYTDARAHLEELRRCLREWTDVVRAGLAAGRTPEEMGTALRQRDATRPGTSSEGVHRLDLVAGHGMSVAGIARYLSRQ